MKIKVAASQFQTIKGNIKENINKAINLADQAVAEEVNIFLLQELFQSEYFCSTQNAKFFDYAISSLDNELFSIFSNYCKKNNIVIPISFFEKQGQNYFNSLIVIDSHGELSEVYRKSHIPDGPGYNEKFYFTPGNTGFKVFKTEFGNIGCGICWDQWFPEAARIMALKGAEILLYPTAIGDELMSEYDSSDAWQTVMRGHAAANIMPVVASNRIGSESVKGQVNGFYGRSFICDRSGKMLAEASKDKEEVIIADVDTEDNHLFRRNWGLFRDRRPELYKEILTLNGKIKD